MDVEFIKTLLKIREYTATVPESYVQFTSPYSMKIYDHITGESWLLHYNNIAILEHYFPDDRNFIAWLNHKKEHVVFEKEMQRYLNLKAFI